jgi:hypothetical protein
MYIAVRMQALDVFNADFIFHDFKQLLEKTVILKSVKKSYIF